MVPARAEVFVIACMQHTCQEQRDTRDRQV
jgi:hypothetical protein